MIKAKIADTIFTQQKGLMFVEHLPQNEGMLFVFSRPSKLSFWGKNTFIPLDIAFIDKNNKISNIASIKPHSLSTVSSSRDCKYALEVNEGYFKQHNIHEGSMVEFNDGPKTLCSAEREFDTTFVIFKEEQKDFIVSTQNFKESQVIDPNKVNKKDISLVGEPIQQQVGNTELPIIDTTQLDSILEDSFDNDEQIDEPVTDEPKNDESGNIDITEQKQYPVFSSAYQATDWAEENGEVVRISYTTKRGRALVRDVEPHGKFHSQSTHREILVTFDETIGDIRAFIINNISHWAFVGKQFEKKFTVKS